MTFGPVPGPVGAPKAVSAGRGVDWQRIKAVILPFLWPRESVQLRVRVVVAFALLVVAKLITVQVPFFFKAVVDRLSGPEDALSPCRSPRCSPRPGTPGGRGLRRAARRGVRQGRRAGRTAGLAQGLRHLFQLSLRYHLERRTGELARITERGVEAIRFLLGVILFNVGPTCSSSPW